MRSLDEIVAEAAAAKVTLEVDPRALDSASNTTTDSVFHTPLVALTILVIVRAKRGGIFVQDIATWTIATLVRHCDILRITRSRVRWSIPLRRRCADGLVFLENVGMISVATSPERTVQITDTGRAFLSGLLNKPTDVGVLVRALDRAHQEVQQTGLEIL